MKHLNVIGLILNALAIGFNITNMGIAVWHDDYAKAFLLMFIVLINTIAFLLCAKTNQ